MFAGSLGNHLVKIEKCGSKVTLEKAEEALNARLKYQTFCHLAMESMY